MKFSRFPDLLLILVLNCLSSVGSAQVEPVPQSLRNSLELDSFYEKYLNAGGLPVVGSAAVSNAAILEAAWIIEKMIGHRPELLRAMAKNGTRMAVMAFDEYTTDVPEHRHLTPRVYWDRRARGLGATPRAPAVSCAEENLLGFPGDPYANENICIHEFAHAIHQMGMLTLDPTFDARLKRAYERAKSAGLWRDTYAISNHQEYWAEAVQSWFGNNREVDSLHNHVNTRRELVEYDPPLADLCREVFGDRNWTYRKPQERVPTERKHLAAVNFDQLPRFQWRTEPAGRQSRVLFQTSMGDFELEFESSQAPRQIFTLLNRVHEGVYSNGEISLFGSGLDTSRQNRVALTPLPEGGSAARGGLLIVPAPGAKSKPPRFLAFQLPSDETRGELHSPRGLGPSLGQVSKGHEVVLKLQRSLVEQASSGAVIKIQRAIRLN